MSQSHRQQRRADQLHDDDQPVAEGSSTVDIGYQLLP